jgi:acyl dehydratase
MMSTAYVSQLMMQCGGAGFVKGGRMSVSFIKPVLVGDTLTVHGRVKSREPEGDGTRVTVEVWCENQDGVKTMVGTASGLEESA